MQRILLIKVTGRTIGLDAERVKEKHSGLENLHSFNCSSLIPYYVPGTGNTTVTKMGRALLSWNSQQIGQ